MREIGAVEAKNTLGALLDLVERGEEVVITRRGKPVARLVREGIPKRDLALQAAANIVARSQGIKLGDVTLRELIDEGRP